MVSRRRKVIYVYDMVCDDCGKKLDLGEQDAVAATSIAFMKHGWDAWKYVEQGKRLNYEGANSCKHRCKECYQKTWR